MMERKAFLTKLKHQCHLSQWGEWIYGVQSWKEKRLLCESVFVLTDKLTLTLKNDGKRSIFYETKASLSLILMKRISLWCPIMKRKKITMWIHVYPNWQKNFNTKNDGKRILSYETKASMSLIPMRKMSLWCPIL